MRITENQIDEWVRANARDAQGVIVELVWRLVAASCPMPKERRFPLGDSIGQHGPDGILNVDLGFDPFVPEGRSFWEVGTNLRAGDKATADYKGLTSGGIPEATRQESTFVFVTPLSARRDWEHTWKEDAQGAWVDDRLARSEWRDIRVIDATKLVDWLHHFPAVSLWFARRMHGTHVEAIVTPDQHWELLRSIGEPPPLTPKVFLAGRDAACEKVKELVAGTTVQLKLDTHFPDQVVDFISACLADLDDERRVDAAGRCLVISGAEAWNAMTAQRGNLILVADPSLDLSGDVGTKLIQKARRNGHSIVYGGAAGGIPDPTSVALRVPRAHQVQDALVQAGYSEERARTLAQKSGGNLASLLRCLQNLSLLPQWAEGTAAAELAIAEILGGWNEGFEGDRLVVEGLSGNSYGEWIGRVRELARSPGTPLTHQDGKWRFTARYEGWYALGPRYFVEHVDQLKELAVAVLSSADPQFDLPKEERYASKIHGKSFQHSPLIRSGLAETLALLGSHSKALSSIKLGYAESAAAYVVRRLLSNAEWQRWAGLNDLLPLLAEAAPDEFLSAVESALSSSPCPFDEVFAQEGEDGFMGRTYSSGLLWALETLAWDPNQLSRAVICLGALAERDPGGRWANRPKNSLHTILLPWLPQTCASLEKRVAAVAMLLGEYPETGWKLLISLLPQAHSTSTGTRRPAWRDTIPDDWTKGVTTSEYSKQALLYSQMAVTSAISNQARLIELINHIENLSPQGQEHVISYLGSAEVVSLPEDDRRKIWSELVDVVTKHRKFSDAVWVMQSGTVEKLAALAQLIAPRDPFFLFQRLFSERDFELYDSTGNYQEQQKAIESRRQAAMVDIEAAGGLPLVLKFASVVKSAWRVGISFGTVSSLKIDTLIFPILLDSEETQIVQFWRGFAWSRFTVHGWPWVDGIGKDGWTATQIGKFLSCFPFDSQTWVRSIDLLGKDEAAYWERTSANPYEASSELETAVAKLIEYKRPFAAVRCLHKLAQDKRPVDPRLAYEALIESINSKEDKDSMDSYDTVELVKALQNNPATPPEFLYRIEWSYLRLLDQQNEASPKFLWSRLANEPEFFCEVIRLVFRSVNETEEKSDLSVEDSKVAGQAYRLLSDWQLPPGVKGDGEFSEERFRSWLKAVQIICAETGHLEIAMTMVGHVLVRSPADPDGLWINKAVADALNAKEAGDLRSGFRTQLYNLRGVHWVDPTGAQEKGLALEYSIKADAVEVLGFHRLATVLRELVATYEREADLVISRAAFDD